MFYILKIFYLSISLSIVSIPSGHYVIPAKRGAAMQGNSDIYKE